MQMRKVVLQRRGQPVAPKLNDKNLDNAEHLQNYIKAQIYVQGFSQQVAVGTSNLANVTSLGGSARWLYGLTIWVSQDKINDDDTFSLTINNEQILINTYWRNFCPAYNYKLDMFFPIPRPLSGSDTLQMSWTAIQAKTVFPQFYLSNFPAQ